MEQYHRIFTEQLEGKLWKGRDPETEVKDLPGVLTTDWGGIYVPEETLDGGYRKSFIDWLFEQAAVDLHAKTLPELTGWERRTRSGHLPDRTCPRILQGPLRDHPSRSASFLPAGFPDGNPAFRGHLPDPDPLPGTGRARGTVLDLHG